MLLCQKLRDRNSWFNLLQERFKKSSILWVMGFSLMLMAMVSNLWILMSNLSLRNPHTTCSCRKHLAMPKVHQTMKICYSSPTFHSLSPNSRTQWWALPKDEKKVTKRSTPKLACVKTATTQQPTDEVQLLLINSIIHNCKVVKELPRTREHQLQI